MKKGVKLIVLQKILQLYYNFNDKKTKLDHHFDGILHGMILDEILQRTF